MSFSDIRENKILAKISGSTVIYLCHVYSFFFYFSSDQLKLVQREVIDTYLYYLSQAPSMSEIFLLELKYILRDINDKCKDENLFLVRSVMLVSSVIKGSWGPENIVQTSGIGMHCWDILWVQRNN